MTAEEDFERFARNSTVRTISLRMLLVFGVLGMFWASYHAGVQWARSFDTITASIRHTDTLLVDRAARVDTVRLTAKAIARAEAKADPLHDTVTVVARDTVELLISKNGGADSVVRVEVPAPVVARIVADSHLITSQRAGLKAFAALVVADSGVIKSQGQTIKLQAAAANRPWWKPEAAVGYGLTLTNDGRITHGVTVLVGWRIR